MCAKECVQKNEGGRFRKLSGVQGIISSLILVLIPLCCLLYILDLHTRFGIVLYKQQYMALFLALFLASTYMNLPFRSKSPKNRIPWYDFLLAIAAFAVFVRVAIGYEDLMHLVGFAPWKEAYWGIAAVLLVLESVRRLIGWPLIIVSLVFILYGHFAYLAPGILEASGVSWNRLFIFLYLDQNSLLGIPVGVAAVMVVGFLFFGSALFMIGGGEFLSNLALAVMGRQRGGAAKMSVIASGLFGSLSGSASANVAVTGMVTIPLMQRTGYKPHFAGAVESAASTGGLILPPVMGITAFMIAEFLQMPYWEVALRSVVPAFLYYLALLTQVHLEAIRTNIKGLSPEETPFLLPVLKEGWLYIVPIFSLLYFLFILYMDPGSAAMYSGLLMLVMGLFRAEIRSGFVSKVFKVMVETGQQVLVVGAACAAAGIVIGCVALTDLGSNLSQSLIAVSGGNVFVLLILAAIATIILGMGMPIAATYIMLAILIVPALVEIGVEPLAAHLFINFFAAMSFVTPPICIAAYVAAGIADCNPMRCGFEATKLGIGAYIVPIAFCYSIGLLFYGSIPAIIQAAAAGTIGVILIAIGLSGHLWAHIPIVLRIIIFFSGVAMMAPNKISILAGAVVGALVILWQLRYRKQGMVQQESVA